MENLFTNAYFGKPYMTRSGEKTLYIKDTNEHRVFVHKLELESGYILCSKYGKVQVSDSPLDIVSEYKATIDEDKLNRLANNYDANTAHFINTDEGITLNYRIMEAFKAGYRIAKMGE